jgi:hypothetical protein
MLDLRSGVDPVFRVLRPKFQDLASRARVVQGLASRARVHDAKISIIINHELLSGATRR